MKALIFSQSAQPWLGLQVMWKLDGEVTREGLKYLCDISSETVNLVRVGLSIFILCQVVRGLTNKIQRFYNNQFIFKYILICIYICKYILYIFKSILILCIF